MYINVELWIMHLKCKVMKRKIQPSASSNPGLPKPVGMRAKLVLQNRIYGYEQRVKREMSWAVYNARRTVRKTQFLKEARRLKSNWEGQKKHLQNIYLTRPKRLNMKIPWWTILHNTIFCKKHSIQEIRTSTTE